MKYAGGKHHKTKFKKYSSSSRHFYDVLHVLSGHAFASVYDDDDDVLNVFFPTIRSSQNQILILLRDVSNLQPSRACHRVYVSRYRV